MSSSGINETSHPSSSFLSCNLRRFFIRSNLSNVNSLKEISFNERTRDIATKESPTVNSLLPRSILVFSNVSPWLLCTVIAQARRKRTCRREHCVSFLPSYDLLIGTIGTTLTPSRLVIVGLSYFLNMTNTATGREGGPCSSNMMSCMTSATSPSHPCAFHAPDFTMALAVP